MTAVTIYTTRFCGFCWRAKHLLDSKNVPYDEINVDGDHEAREVLAKRAGRHTVPQIWIADYHVGGCDELHALDRAGRLDELLTGN